MENRDIRDLFCGWAEGKGRGSRKRWVLLIEEEMSNKIIEVNLTDVFSKCFKRGARVPRGWIKTLATTLETIR